METIIIKINNQEQDLELLEKAGKVLQDGGLVAFPTETVYGIGANALDPKAIVKIYEAKGRPSDNPLIVHIAKEADLEKYVTSVSPAARKLIEAFWPGPLTLVFEKQDCIPMETSGRLSTVAIRMPAHEIARKIIELSGVPVAAPSANVSGRPSPTQAKHVIEDLSGRVDMIVDGGDAEIGLESTVLDVTGHIPMILRPGGVTKEMLEAIVGEVEIDPAILNHQEVKVHLTPKAPGMKYKHYAPKGKMTVVVGDEDKVREFISTNAMKSLEAGRRVGIIATAHHIEFFEAALKDKNVMIQNIGREHHAKEIASNLFKVLRLMDEHKMEEIYTFDFSTEHIGMATMNRLMKAAGNNVVNVNE